MSRCQFNGVTAMNRMWKPSVEMSPAGPICPLTHLSCSFFTVCRFMNFPAREKAAVFASEQPWALRSPEPQRCLGPVLWGRDMSCMQEQRARQSHPCTKHTCTDASAVCHVSAPLPEQVKLQEGWEKPRGTVEGGTQGCRGAAA